MRQVFCKFKFLSSVGQGSLVDIILLNCGQQLNDAAFLDA